MFEFLKHRAFEPSSWAGLAVLLEALKVVAPGYAGLIAGVQGIFGGVAVVLREVGHGRGA